MLRNILGCERQPRDSYAQQLQIIKLYITLNYPHECNGRRLKKTELVSQKSGAWLEWCLQLTIRKKGMPIKVHGVNEMECQLCRSSSPRGPWHSFGLIA
jgi:hypothetical protein